MRSGGRQRGKELASWRRAVGFVVRFSVSAKVCKKRALGSGGNRMGDLLQKGLYHCFISQPIATVTSLIGYNSGRQVDTCLSVNSRLEPAKDRRDGN